MVEIRLNDPGGPIPVLLSGVLKHQKNRTCMLNSKWSCSFSTSGTMKCLYFSFFSISEEKLKDLLWGAKRNNNKENVWCADMMTDACGFTQ